MYKIKKQPGDTFWYFGKLSIGLLLNREQISRFTQTTQLNFSA